MTGTRDEYENVSMKFSESNLLFLLWAMEFIEGGPHDFETLASHRNVQKLT